MKRGEHPTSNIQHPTSSDEGASRHRAYDLEERLLDYAVRIIRLVDELPKSRGGDHIGGQLLRSGTSPTLNHGEVQAAESLADFVHKLKICLKELRESRRALLIIERKPLADDLEETRALTCETEQLIRIFFASIRTANARREPSARVREDSERDREDGALADIEPSELKVGWMSDVGCSTLDVLSAALAEVEGGQQ